METCAKLVLLASWLLFTAALPWGLYLLVNGFVLGLATPDAIRQMRYEFRKEYEGEARYYRERAHERARQAAEQSSRLP